MKKWLKTLPALALGAVVATTALVGCDGEDNNGSFQQGAAPFIRADIDLVVGSRDAGENDRGLLAFYFDVLRQTDTNGNYLPPTMPDVTIDLGQSGTPIIDGGNGDLVDAQIQGDDLYVLLEDGGNTACNATTNGSVLIWRDFDSISANHTAPDVELCNDVEGSRRIYVDGTYLIAMEESGDEISIWNDLDTLVTADAADHTFTMSINSPVDVQLYENSLFVSNASTTTDTDPQVSIWDDFDTLFDNLTDQAADVTLDEETSFMDFGLSAKELLVSNDNLYVTVYGDGQHLFVFNTDGIADNDLPSALIIGYGTVFNASALHVFGPNDPDNGVFNNYNTLYTATSSFDCNEEEGTLSGFFNADALVDGQDPGILIGQAYIQNWSTEEITSAGGSLFAGGRSSCDYTSGAVAIWVNAANIPNDKMPTYVINGIEDGFFDEDPDDFERPFTTVNALAVRENSQQQIF